MSAAQTKAFLAALGDSGLVPEPRLAEISTWADESGADPAALARELRRRGSLSDYQIREVARGRGAGLTVGPYALVAPIGEGGMGLVFKATHARLGSTVALKLIRPEKSARPASLERFYREIRAAAQLAHPNVVLAIDAGADAGRHYLAMELVEGTDLGKLVETAGPLDCARAADYICQAAAGLQHAHDRGLVHRDVKPSNLLLTPRGQVKVADLGLALLTHPEESDSRVTQAGSILGTPDFLAPEQARDPLNVDARADVYALGATLYYLLTGRVPYEGATATEVLIRHATDPPPSLLAARPDAPPALDAAIRHLMAKKPSERPQSAADAARVIAAAVATESPATGGADAIPADEFAFAAGPASPRVVTERGARKSRTPLVAVGAVVAAGLAVAGAVVGATVFGPAPPPDPALAASHANPAGLELVRVPGGRFLMGATPGEPGADASTPPPREVSVGGPFFVGATEVTEGQYLKLMRQSPAHWPRRSRRPDLVPVDRVTWPEAVAFCERLTAADANLPAGWAYRLPSEAEWEYACRAGTDGPFGGAATLVYGKGGVFDLALDAKTGRHGEEDVTRTRMERGLPYPAGTTEPNAFGLKDCHGNVWEWTRSPFASESPGAFRAVRGGSWREPAARCTSATRRGLAPEERRDDVGFRVVLAPTGD